MEGSARALIRSNRKGKGTRDSPSAVPSLPHSFSPYSSERYSLRKMEHIVVYMCVHILLYHHRRLYYIDHSPAQPSPAQHSPAQHITAQPSTTTTTLPHSFTNLQSCGRLTHHYTTTTPPHCHHHTTYTTASPRSFSNRQSCSRLKLSFISKRSPKTKDPPDIIASPIICHGRHQHHSVPRGQGKAW